MRSIEALTPQAGADDPAGLREVDANELARYAADPAHPWWRRRSCVTALTGRVPEPYVPELIARIQDPADTAEVRRALLDLLSDRAELLPWLRHEDRASDASYGMAAAFLKARGLLGDLSAARELATLAASPWRHTRDTGDAGLDGLVDRYGAEIVVAELGEDRPEYREFRVRKRYRAGEDVTYALADPDRRVAHLAHTLATDADRLRACLDEAPTPEAKVWAACALHRLTEDRAEARAAYERLGRPRVEVEGLDEELRGALVREYGPGCERPSDPRWRLEAVCAVPPRGPDVDDLLRRATAALTAGGLAPKPPVSCGDDNQQGDGTYYVIEAGGDRLLLSTLGPFVTAAEPLPEAVVRALVSAGFRWIDDETGALRVTDLCVYYFGAREPLTVGELLFYWQD
ncbi:hypothetical protein ACIOMM_09375 [Streptomyces sp. NPDC087908]|uniref:hypothetical protein n=1 Tax=Streptomyces sp. NPDC087908 TaxID=3365820 RepID=UPI00380658FD